MWHSPGHQTFVGTSEELTRTCSSESHAQERKPVTGLTGEDSVGMKCCKEACPQRRGGSVLSGAELVTECLPACFGLPLWSDSDYLSDLELTSPGG